MRIVLFPNIDNLSKYCIYSIKRISIFKNEILLSPISASEIYGNDIFPDLLYTDNFILSRIDELKLGKNSEQSLEENLELSETIPEKIISNFNYLKKYFYDNSRKGLKYLVDQTEQTYREYSVKIEKTTKTIKYLFKKLGKYKGAKYENEFNKNTTDNHELIKYFKGELSYIEENSNEDYLKYLNYPENKFKSLKKYLDLNLKLVEEESLYFDETYTDKYKYYLLQKINFLKYLEHILPKFHLFSEYKNTIKRFGHILIDLENYSSEWINQMFEKIKESYVKLIELKINDLFSVMNKLEISLQNVKLIKIKETKLYLKIYKKNSNPSKSVFDGYECKSINIIRNSYYDNFFSKILINYNITNIDSENILVLKFLNRRFFYYLKITFSKIELWSKKLNDDFLVGEYDIFTETDKYNKVKDFSKLIYLLVKIDKGKMIISIKLDYDLIPNEIIKYLDELKTITYDEMIKIYQLDYNHFQEYYKNCTVIFEKSEVDLVRNIF